MSPVHIFEGATAEEVNNQLELWQSNNPSLRPKNLKLVVGERIALGVIFETVEPVKTVTGDNLSQVLMSIGFTPKFLGFNHTKTAVELIQKDISMVYSITAKLYPAVPEIHKTTASRVERAIRNAIKTAWETGKLGKIYPWHQKCPTNSEFLATLVEKLVMQKAG